MRKKEIVRLFKRELIVYQRVLQDERTPTFREVVSTFATGYLCMPFDLIPDFIPRIGRLDDAVIIPALVFAALRSSFRASLFLSIASRPLATKPFPYHEIPGNNR